MKQATLPWKPLSTSANLLPGYLVSCFNQPGSMTRFLRSLGSELTVTLLHQDMIELDQDNAQFLQSTDQVCALTRQVILSVDQKPALFGQCMMDEKTCSQLPWVKTLGAAAIGERLFQDPNLTRNNIEVTSLPANSMYHDILSSICDITGYTLWARRSYLQDNTIRVGVIDICLPWLSELLTKTQSATRA